MSTPNDNKRQQLISKLKELFQLDQPDLDFGLYRIMHAKSAEITQFLEKDLLPQVADQTIEAQELLQWTPAMRCVSALRPSPAGTESLAEKGRATCTSPA